mmetsp:Transcript_112228/g.281225  ORF Transcript_112228/g.281225 Transcript_112228/m.281225 type:complete len:93 (-) Transcript_112228:115-393(-)
MADVDRVLLAKFLAFVMEKYVAAGSPMLPPNRPGKVFNMVDNRNKKYLDLDEQGAVPIDADLRETSRVMKKLDWAPGKDISLEDIEAAFEFH